MGSATLADYLFGADPETMTPEQRRALEYVWQELGKSDMALGFSPQEKMGMQKKLKTGLRDYGQERIKSGGASLARRGVYGPGEAAALTTSTIADTGRAYGEGLTDIDLASTQAGRQRKSQLMGMLPGLSAGYLPQEPDLGGGISDFISNLAYYYASKGQKPGAAGQLPRLPRRRSFWDEYMNPTPYRGPV
jgi:hypothetical protein